MRIPDHAACPIDRSGFRLAARLHWPVFLLAASAGLLLGALRELRRPPAFEASSWISLLPQEESWESPSQLPALRPDSASPLRRIEAVLSSELFLREALAEFAETSGSLALKDAAAIRDLRSRLRIDPLDPRQPDTGIRLTVRARHPEEAVKAADRLAEALVESDLRKQDAVRDAEIKRLESELARSRQRAEGLENALAAARERDSAETAPAGTGTPADTAQRRLRRELVAEGHLVLSLEAKLQAATLDSGTLRPSMELARRADAVAPPMLWRPWPSLALGALLGGLAGLLLIRLVGLRRLPQTLSERYGKLPGLRLTAVLPLPSTGQGDPATLQGSRVEPYRALRLNLRRLPAADSLALAFHPAGSASVCDEVLATLAPVLASAGHSVIVVDADPDQSRLHETFEAGRHPGLADYLSGEMRLEETVVRLTHANLWFLPSGRPAEDFGELLAGKRMPDLVSALRSRFDYVLILSPSIRERTEAALVCGHADHTLAVVDVHRDTPRATRKIREWLQAYDCHVSGVLVTHRLQLREASHPLPFPPGRKRASSHPTAPRGAEPHAALRQH